MVRLTILIWILIWFRSGFDLKSRFNFSSRLNFSCGFDVVLPPLYTRKVSSLNTCFLLFFTYTLTVSTYGFHLRFPLTVSKYGSTYGFHLCNCGLHLWSTLKVSNRPFVSGYPASNLRSCNDSYILSESFNDSHPLTFRKASGVMSFLTIAKTSLPLSLVPNLIFFADASCEIAHYEFV